MGESSSDATGTDGSPEDIELPSSPSQYVGIHDMKSMEAIIEERMLHED